MKFIGVAALALGVAYIGYCALLLFTQRNIVFPRAVFDPERLAQLKAYHPNLEDVVLEVPGAELRGWLLPRKGKKALIYYGGNAEEASAFFLWAPQALPDVSILSVNYRGYGNSAGTPGEAEVKQDALAVYDMLQKRLGPDADIAVMGRSLGAGAAAHAAAKRDPAAAILVTPYDSFVNVGRDNYSLIPVALLLKYPFNALPDAAASTAPALFLAADNDRLVNPERARALAQAWKGPHEFRMLPGGHNSISDHPDYWKMIKAYLDGVMR